jgi:DNA repair protein RadB
MQFPISDLNQYIKVIPLNGIFSVFGDFGVGKTIFCIQTALNSAKKAKKVIYIYTKPNFPSERFLSMINSNEILDEVDLIQTTDFNELSKIIFNLEFLLLKYYDKKRTEPTLIVIDSITNLYRLKLNKGKKETNYNLNYKLNQILATLAYLNRMYGIEILITNEITRKKTDDLFVETQSGGLVMDYWANYNLKITKTSQLNVRKFFLTDNFMKQSFEFFSNLSERGFE